MDDKGKNRVPTLPLTLLGVGIIICCGALLYLANHDYTVACYDAEPFDNVTPPGCGPKSKTPTIVVAGIGGAIALLGLLALAIGSAARSALTGHEATPKPASDHIESLARAVEMHRTGALSDAEFAQLKRTILADD